MTRWSPLLDEIDEAVPRYRALADALARDVAEGRLAPGDRLPTHRELARTLGVTVGTVSRGYAEAERRGLTTGEVGRGTFVRGSKAPDPWPEPTTRNEAVDLSLSLPVSVPEEAAALEETLRQIADDGVGDGGAGALLGYQPQTGSPRQRAIAAEWLSRTGLRVGADDVWCTAGSQHGLNVVLSTVFRPSQVLLTGELTYPSIKSQARSFGVRLRGVELDDEGIRPDAVERACRQEPRPAGLYVIPTLQNPTSAVQSEERRRALAEVARAHDLWIVEDDVHSFLLPDPPPPIAAYAPERGVLLSSVAKCLAPGLRTGFLVAPEPLRARLLSGIHTSLWMPPPLMVEITTRWLADGTADRLIAAKRRETESRQRLAERILGRHRMRRHPSGYQVWLELPEPWYTDEFVAQARARGVIVIGAGAFAVGRRSLPQAVRLAIGVPGRSELERGLRNLDEMLVEGTAPGY